jgi:hypothetical protein
MEDGASTATDRDILTDEEERCPECDQLADWEVSRRHRYSPFGSVLLAVLAFWSAVFGWTLGFGYLPAALLLAGAVVTGVSTRKAEVCSGCGYVRPRH